MSLISMMFSNRVQYSTWLVFAGFLLFPFYRSVELPVLVMTIGGIVLLYKHGKAMLSSEAIKLFTLLFACIWIPMLISVPGSHNVQVSITNSLAFIRLYLAGLFVIWAFRDSTQISLLARLLALLAGFWVLDALLQFGIGRDVFGYANPFSRLNGVFGEDDMKLGNALPVMAPFLLLALRNNPFLMLMSALLTGMVVILAGSRGGWASYGLVCMWLIVSETRRRGIAIWKIGALVVLTTMLGTFVAFKNPDAKQRLDQTLLLFSGDEAQIDQALSLRWTIWKNSFPMIEDHPASGVGVRAYRYAYPDYAQNGDPFVTRENAAGEPVRPTGAFYAHQIILEVVTETGLIGLAGLVLFYGLLVRQWLHASQEGRVASLPFAMGAMAWIFPFNTHPAFYSAQWSILIWLMIAIWCASIILSDKTQARHI